MGKKDEEKEPEKTKETPPPTDPNIEKKVEEKIDKVEDKIEKKTGKRENLIGDLADPKINDDFDYKTWSKSVDERLDRILSFHDKKSDDPKPTDPPPKKPWYEEELF